MSRVRVFAALIAAASASAPLTASAQGDETSPAENAQSESIASATAFAESLMAGATAALTDDSMSEAEQLTNFQALLTEGLALDTIGRFMLGEARKTMTDEQTLRYNTIFPPYITKLYANQFSEIVGKPLSVIDAKAIGARDVIVRTQLDRTDATPIMVDWRIRKLRSGEHKAIDIIVSGVSIMLVKREEFSAFIAQNNVDALLARLETEAV